MFLEKMVLFAYWPTLFLKHMKFYYNMYICLNNVFFCTVLPSLSTPYVNYLFSDIRPLVCPVTFDLISDSEYGVPDESLTASSGKTICLHCKSYKKHTLTGSTLIHFSKTNAFRSNV